MGPMIPKEMKYNLYYGKVRGDVLPPPHGTNTSCSVVKKNVKKIAFGNKEHTTDKKMGVSVLSLCTESLSVIFTHFNIHCYRSLVQSRVHRSDLFDFAQFTLLNVYLYHSSVLNPFMHKH